MYNQILFSSAVMCSKFNFPIVICNLPTFNQSTKDTTNVTNVQTDSVSLGFTTNQMQFNNGYKSSTAFKICTDATNGQTDSALS